VVVGNGCNFAGPGRHGRHPQQPAPEATACALAGAPQQPPDAAASAAVPQHGSAEDVCGKGLAAAVPQQPPAAGGVRASPGSPANPPAFDALVSVVT
jgi:hypothetical protein